jgi:hypothetical protein
MSGAYANVRNTDLARPMVNVGQAPTYFWFRMNLKVK